MAEFLGDIAFMIEVLVLGLGLVVLHFSKKEGSDLLKWSGRIMCVFGFLGMICTSYYYMKYFWSGEFHHAHHATMMSRKGAGYLMHDMDHCLSKASGTMMNTENQHMLKECLQSGSKN